MKKSSKTTGEASGMLLRKVQLAQHAHRNEPLKKVGILQNEVASLQIVDTGEMESSLKDQVVVKPIYVKVVQKGQKSGRQKVIRVKGGASPHVEYS